jgi:hypothetical protein
MLTPRRPPVWILLVLVLVLGACTSPPTADEHSAQAPSATPDAPVGSLRPGSLTIEEPDWNATGANWTLDVSWRAPDDAAIDHYEVARDRVTVDDSVTGTVFRDRAVEPGVRYRYEVVGVAADGTRTRPATLSIKTDEPPLAEARLEGTFVVRMVVARASGTRNPVRGGAIFFAFDPICNEGACAVRWGVRKARTDGTLRHTDAMYAARLHTPLFVRNCYGAVVDEGLDVRLRVSAAAALRGRWRATRIEGTIEEVSSYGGCVTATIDWNVRGALQS